MIFMRQELRATKNFTRGMRKGVCLCQLLSKGGWGRGASWVGREEGRGIFADICADKKAFKSYFDIINDS